MHLPRQRWFASGPADLPVEVTLGSLSILRDEWPLLVRAVVSVGDARWQVVVGMRSPAHAAGVVEGKPESVIGEIATPLGHALAYDATIDPELALTLLEQAAGDARVARARHLNADQSNTCVVFDERLIMKVFRRLSDGPNPDVEVGGALGRAGFPSVPAQVGRWHEDGADLAVVHEYLVGGVDGFHMALTSLHDLFDVGGDPAGAGGDFAPDAHRLGTVTAELHLALAAAFGAEAGERERWSDEMLANLGRVPIEGADVEEIRGRFEGLRASRADVGPALRIHGDYHLGQVLRTDSGWYVLDFEGEPARPLHERTRPSSPLRDVAGMLRSFHYAGEVALRDFGYGDEPAARMAAAAWEERTASAFLDGYLETGGIGELLPAAVEDRRVVLDAFLLDKAVYEVGYELAHRPDWVNIPLAAIRRLLTETAPRPEAEA
ncbi:MAG TPA: phosphotransferase [Acidimicrobiales bacterium]